MRGATLPLPQYAFMAWCLVKHRDNFTLRSSEVCGGYLEEVTGVVLSVESSNDFWLTNVISEVELSSCNLAVSSFFLPGTCLRNEGRIYGNKAHMQGMFVYTHKQVKCKCEYAYSVSPNHWDSGCPHHQVLNRKRNQHFKVNYTYKHCFLLL
jgi:hypothetical protein